MNGQKELLRNGYGGQAKVPIWPSSLAKNGDDVIGKVEKL
jgi:hypothetical protein